jgi:ubiquinone/menaquinone biosynthesis C-methylase UbiE
MDPFEPYARYYDLDHGEFDDDVMMFEGFAARCGSPILELGCGTGRLLLPLARQGYHVTGVDVSAAMLERARRRLSTAGLADQVTLVQQDMRSLSLDGQFKLVVIGLSSFQILSTLQDQLKTLERICAHLVPDGLLVIDLFFPDLNRLLESAGQVCLDKVMSDPETGDQVVRLHSQHVDQVQQLIHVTYQFDRVDAAGNVCRTLVPLSIRYLFRPELELLLRHAGFEVEAVYGSYDLEELAADSERLIAVARLGRRCLVAHADR